MACVTPESTPIRVFLLDDHEIVRHGVRGLLEAESDIAVVGEAGTVADATPAILRLRPHVAVLDERLPDGSGIEVCRQVRAANPAVKCLILTSSDDPDIISNAILAGAAGYVLKQIESNSLVTGIRLVAGGHSLIDPQVAAQVVGRVQQAHRQAAEPDALAGLTPQQTRILFLLAEGMTNREIAQELGLAEKTVKNHVTGLLAKLGLQHRTQAALMAMRLRSR